MYPPRELANAPQPVHRAMLRTDSDSLRDRDMEMKRRCRASAIAVGTMAAVGMLLMLWPESLCGIRCLWVTGAAYCVPASVMGLQLRSARQASMAETQIALGDLYESEGRHEEANRSRSWAGQLEERSYTSVAICRLLVGLAGYFAVFCASGFCLAESAARGCWGTVVLLLLAPGVCLGAHRVV
mmetsp:Transcript_79456/g.182139  ORF Transcript_79456/g.182139 Transcript_79456/m.182139 type:complete len:184 (-) Transcript_79456:249-800(-)